jgi:hypothetical protein
VEGSRMHGGIYVYQIAMVNSELEGSRRAGLALESKSGWSLDRACTACRGSERVKEPRQHRLKGAP